MDLISRALTLIIAFCAILGGISQPAQAGLHDTLKTYDELIALESNERMRYLAQVRELIQILDGQQARNEVAYYSFDNAELREQLATLVELFSVEGISLEALALLPQAQAKTPGARQQGVRPSAPTAPLGPTAALAPPPPPLSAPPVETAASRPGGAVSAGAPAVAGVTPPTTATPITKTPQACTKPALSCDQYDLNSSDPKIKKDVGDLQAEFRKITADNVCIYGGAFSTYPVTKVNGKEVVKKTKGTCIAPTEFPVAKGQPPFSCNKKSEVMCDPFMFCVGTKQVVEGKEVTVAKLPHCEPRGGDATKRCKTYFDGFAKAEGQTIAGKVYHTCDPSEVMGTSGSRKAWAKIKQSVESLYKAKCSDKKFLSLFCNECATMGERLWAMNKESADMCKVVDNEASGVTPHPPELLDPIEPNPVTTGASAAGR